MTKINLDNYIENVMKLWHNAESIDDFCKKYNKGKFVFKITNYKFEDKKINFYQNDIALFSQELSNEDFRRLKINQPFVFR
jgi:hypothetical protein